LIKTERNIAGSQGTNSNTSLPRQCHSVKQLPRDKEISEWVSSSVRRRHCAKLMTADVKLLCCMWTHVSSSGGTRSFSS